jgi:hypothetical protein
MRRLMKKGKVAELESGESDDDCRQAQANDNGS